MEEHSQTAFYVAGLVLVIFALGVSALGIRRPQTFPDSAGGRAALIGVCAVLVAVAMVTSVLTA